MEIPDSANAIESLTVRMEWFFLRHDGYDEADEGIFLPCSEEEADFKQYIFTGFDKSGQEWGLAATVPWPCDDEDFLNHVVESGRNSVMFALDKANTALED
jgi:hypothetical protein